jgi:hypothetical protein
VTPVDSQDALEQADDAVMAAWDREDTEAFLAFLEALEADWRL